MNPEEIKVGHAYWVMVNKKRTAVIVERIWPGSVAMIGNIRIERDVRYSCTNQRNNRRMTVYSADRFLGEVE